MGNWNINIQGIGAHHNSSTSDIDFLVTEFINKIHNAGQRIEIATLTYGGKEDLTPKDMVVCLINGVPHKFERGSIVWGDKLAKLSGKPDAAQFTVVNTGIIVNINSYLLADKNYEIII